jgi:hypothetical protein
MCVALLVVYICETNRKKEFSTGEKSIVAILLLLLVYYLGMIFPLVSGIAMIKG